MATKVKKDQRVTIQIPEDFDARSTKYITKSLTGSGFRLVGKHEVAATVGLSHETLKKIRLQEHSPWIEGIHYHVWNSRTIRYNLELLADWAVNRNNPEAHERSITAYLASLPSNQPKARGRRAS